MIEAGGIMLGENIIKIAHEIIKDNVKAGECVVDATCGNGNDTLMLAKLVGEKGHVYSFDIQEQAIDNTKNLLSENIVENVTLLKMSHAYIYDELKAKEGEIKAVIFNLGYLPGADNSITTNYESTIKAIESSLQILKTSGIILLVVYVGHTEGALEKIKIEEYVKKVSPRVATVLKYEVLNRDKAPYILVIKKKL